MYNCCDDTVHFQRRYCSTSPAKGVQLERYIQGRPPKDDKYTETNKVNELKYIIARKDAKIKALEMENKLMRDFLPLTERK